MERFTINNKEFIIDFLPVNEERFVFTLNNFLIRNSNDKIIFNCKLGIALNSFSLLSKSNCLVVECWIKNKPGLMLVDLKNSRITIVDKGNIENKYYESDFHKIKIYNQTESNLILDQNKSKVLLTEQNLREIELKHLTWYPFDNQNLMYRQLIN